MFPDVTERNGRFRKVRFKRLALSYGRAVKLDFNLRR